MTKYKHKDRANALELRLSRLLDVSSVLMQRVHEARATASGLESTPALDELGILSRLTSFVKSHVDFFATGINNKYELKFDSVRGLTKEYALRAVLLRVLMDYDIWMNVFNQCIFEDSKTSTKHSTEDLSFFPVSYKPRPNPYPAEHLAELIENNLPNFERFGELPLFTILLEGEWEQTMNQAEILAQHAIKFAEYAYDFDEISTAITYFSVRASVRSIPYVPIALIAVPYTSVNVKRDLLAIPHEVGHFVFWRGKMDVDGEYKFVSQVALEEQSHLYDPIWKRWAIEIFADVFGAVLAGGLMAQDFQDYLIMNYHKDFLVSDGYHPTPALRPVVHLAALKHFLPYRGKIAHHIADMENQWKEYLAERGITKNTLIQIDYGRSVTLPEFEDKLEWALDNEIGVFKALAELKKVKWSHDESDNKVVSWMNLGVSLSKNMVGFPRIDLDDVQNSNETASDDVQNDDENVILLSETKSDDLLSSWENILSKITTKGLRDQLNLTSNQKSISNHSYEAKTSSDNKDDIWQQWAESRFDFIIKESSDGDTEGDDKTPRLLQAKEWLQVLDADDWTSEGPHTPKVDDGPP